MARRLKNLWEYFMKEPNGTSKMDAWYNVLAFTVDIIFEETLMENGFDIEEATAICMMDTYLREDLVTNPEMDEITIDIE